MLLKALVKYGLRSCALYFLLRNKAALKETWMCHRSFSQAEEASLLSHRRTGSCTPQQIICSMADEEVHSTAECKCFTEEFDFE